MKRLSHMLIHIAEKAKRLLGHTLYIKLLVLLSCIACAVVLMQAGSLFLQDYIPNGQRSILSIQQHKHTWQYRLLRLEYGTVKRDENMAWSLDAKQAASAELQWLQMQDDVALKSAVDAWKQAQDTFAEQAGQGAEANKQAINNIVNVTDNLIVSLQRDIEVKQSVVALLQIISSILIFCCLGSIAIGGRKILVQRVDALAEFIQGHVESTSSRQDEDEFESIERIVYQLSARLEGYKAESEWFNQTSSERLRRMNRSQDFIYSFVESVNHSILGETTLKKSLFQLQKAMNVNNVALIFTDNDHRHGADKVLFSHHKPMPLDEAIFQELTQANIVKHFHAVYEGSNTQCLAVAFSSTSGALGILKVEAEADYVFNDTDHQLLEVTAQLLSMVMGFQGREQEGRRVALLEERAAIARELHDSLAQSLAFMKIQIARLQPRPNSTLTTSDLQEIVDELGEGLNTAYRELRELLATFRVHMDVRGLGFAIQAAIDEFMQRSNLTITLDNRLVNCRLTVNEEFHMLHVVREALSNIVRHSGAKEVTVALVYQASGSLMVTVDDDGVGFPAKAEESDHYGQLIMKERAYNLGGDLTILKRRKGGTRVRLVFTPKLPQ